MKYLIALCLILTTPVFAQEADQDITEGKIAAAVLDQRQELEKNIEEKMQKAITLIVKIAEMADDYSFSMRQDSREQAEYAHTGHLAILQGIREHREALAKKNLEPELKDLQKYSKSLDSIISNAQEILK